MKVVCFAGFSGSGKTTLLEGVIAALKGRGLRVSVIKHAHHRFDIDHPGKDSYRHREAGAVEVLIASDKRVALLRELEQPQQQSVHSLLAQLDNTVDWVLVEGFKTSDLPKIEVWRPSVGHAALHPDDAHVIAVATDAPEQVPQASARPSALQVLDINQSAALAQWLVDNGQRFEYLA
jgi:molybdopterin-guanine dinucleotide biosynthesis adapter protein